MGAATWSVLFTAVFLVRQRVPDMYSGLNEDSFSKQMGADKDPK